LKRFRIIELGQGVSAAFAGRNLAGFGAEVIKVEAPGTGDSTRRAGPYRDDRLNAEASGLYLYLNAGKKSLTLDPSTTTGAELLRELIGQADGVLENCVPGTLKGWGCDPVDLIAANPRLVITSVSPYGSTGPHAGWHATNLTSFASGSQMAATGDPAREPLCTGGYQAEYQAGINAFSASVLALYIASRTGKGQRIDISGQECMAGASEAVGPLARHARDRRPRQGQHRFSFVAINKCADGWAGIFGTHQQRRQIASALGMPELLDDPRLADMPAILAHDEELTPIVERFMAAHTKAELTEIAGRSGLTLNPVATIGEIAASPHLAEREFFETRQHPVAGDVTLPGRPFKSATIDWGPGVAPLLGEHTQEICQSLLGLTASQTIALRNAGII